MIGVLLLACAGPPDEGAPGETDAGEGGDDSGATDSAGDSGGPVGEDADGDGHASVATGGDDCDDADPWTYAGATEMCDDRDQDCDGDPLAEGACAEDAHIGAVAERSWWLDPHEGELYPEFILPDEDGDGTPEVMLSFSGLDVNGLVWLPGSTLTGSADIADAWGAQFSRTSSDSIEDMAPAGDFDGDGWDDFWVTSLDQEGSFNGRAYLIAGPASDWTRDGPTFEEAARFWWGEERSASNFVSSIAAGRDFDGDGRSDVVAGGGDGGERTPWVTYVLQAPADSAGQQSLSDAVTLYGGWSGSAVPDLDGDGTDDVIDLDWHFESGSYTRWISGAELVSSDGADLADLGTAAETTPYNCNLSGKRVTSMYADWNGDGKTDIICQGGGGTAILDFPYEAPAGFDIEDYVLAKIPHYGLWALYPDEDGDAAPEFGMYEDTGDAYQYCIFPSSALAFGGVADFSGSAACMATEMTYSVNYWHTFPYDAEGDGDGELLTYEADYPYDGLQHLWVWDLEGIPWGQDEYW